MWTKEKLKSLLKERIGDDMFVVVSNREPYVHKWKQGKLTVNKPASGLITAMDPMLRACDGVWIAHGSGSADRKVVDEKDRVRVPPGEDLYTLRRVWLSKEDERGYYYGFSNGTFWPLCHIAFARPSFEAGDWESYKRVNRLFADAVLEEIGDKKAFVWIQDYHFALLPQMLKESRPDLLVAQFWHIPWPNPEIFRICPWAVEILNGLLGNDLLGFHIQMHCDNFINTVERHLEARVDREKSTIFHHGGVGTKVLAFPISVDDRMIGIDVEKDYSQNDIVIDAMQALPSEYEHLAVGIDRIDYTKGIPERLRAVDRFLEKYPQMIGKFVYLQMGALSRIHIGLYKDLNDEITKMTEEINWKYGMDEWNPVVLLRRNLTYPEVLLFYKMADICIVSSLHDGMNLVAKEFVSSRNDEDGVLMLSRFTGAARELEDNAVIINPYDIEGFADAIYSAVTMPKSQRVEKMKKMRELVAENNIYKWGASFISELAKLA